MKRCTICGTEKPLSEFHSRKESNDGKRKDCAQCVRARVSRYRAENREKVLASKRASWARHLEKNKARQKTWREENREAIAARRSAKKDWRRRYSREYSMRRRWSDLDYRLRVYMRARLNRAVSVNTRAGSVVRDLGCSIAEFKAHIASMFSPGMSWDNYGKWHIDHIRPLSSFDLTDRDQFLVACHYTNMQPLWASDNLSKGARVE